MALASASVDEPSGSPAEMWTPWLRWSEMAPSGAFFGQEAAMTLPRLTPHEFKSIVDELALDASQELMRTRQLTAELRKRRSSDELDLICERELRIFF